MADVVANGVRHHVQRLGAGPRTVVLLHGLVMDNLSSFYFSLASPIARSASVVLYDLRGHGLSERPPTGYALADFVADLDALLDALSIEGPVDLVGNSFGGLLALAFAIEHPARARSLALVDGHVGEPGWGDRMAATLDLRGEALDERIAASFQSWLGRHSARKRTRLAQAAEALVHGTSMVAELRASPPLAPERLRALEAPVLALYGERSDLRPEGERLASTLPRCTLRLVPGSTHSVLWEATALVQTELAAWLDAGASAGG
jgi:pimeloyl-ACP methyl ester carboxylesterase